MSEEPQQPPLPPVPDLCWPVDWGCADEAWVQELDERVRARAEALAVSTLRALTGFQVGGCPVMVRPCASSCGTTSFITAVVTAGESGALGGPVGQWWPHIGPGGNWTNLVCGCRSGCSCGFVPEVVLPGPVGSVVQVLLDGAVLDPSAYRVDDGHRLVRVDGGVWPTCQHMARQVGEPGTFAVVYTPGVAPDGLAAAAAGRLAVEFAQACTGGKCKLPSGVTQIARQGVTLEIPTGLFPGGVTGMIDVDAWVRLWNPHALVTRSRVWSPDLPAHRWHSPGQVSVP